MPELNDAAIPAALSGDISDDDLVLVYDFGAASNKSRKATRAAFLTGVVRTGEDATLGVVDADELNAPVGAIDALAVATSLTIGATLQKVLTASGTLTLGSIASGAEGSGTLTVTGAVSGDAALLHLPATFPAGLLLSRVVVTGSNTVTAYFYNVTGGSIGGAGYTARATVLRFA